MKIIDKIKEAYEELKAEGIRPDLLILNVEMERSLFTEGTIPKSISAEEFFLDKEGKYGDNFFGVELLVTKLKTEPEFKGSYLMEKV